MPFVQSSQLYRVEYLCTANPRRPVWREDTDAGPFSLDGAIERAHSIARQRPAVRVLDEVDTVVFQYPRTIAA